MLGLVLISGFFATISLTRAGIHHFWSKGGRYAPNLKVTEVAAATASADKTKADPKKAEAKVRNLLRKFGDTPAGKRARETYPKVAEEEDAKKAGGGN